MTCKLCARLNVQNSRTDAPFTEIIEKLPLTSVDLELGFTWAFTVLIISGHFDVWGDHKQYKLPAWLLHRKVNISPKVRPRLLNNFIYIWPIVSWKAYNLRWQLIYLHSIKPTLEKVSCTFSSRIQQSLCHFSNCVPQGYKLMSFY